MSKAMKMVLVGSFLLNALLIGILIGKVSDRLFRKDFPMRKPPEFGLKLPPDKEKLFWGAMDRVFRENRDIHKQTDEARERVLSILSAPEFDEAAYQVETAKLDELRGITMKRLAEATKELAKQFNQEERRVLSEHLRRPPPPPLHEVEPPSRPGPKTGPF